MHLSEGFPDVKLPEFNDRFSHLNLVHYSVTTIQYCLLSLHLQTLILPLSDFLRRVVREYLDFHWAPK